MVFGRVYYFLALEDFQTHYILLPETRDYMFED